MMRPLRWKLAERYDAEGKIATCVCCGIGKAGMCGNARGINESSRKHEVFA
jgi:hypothetical protein